MSPKSVRKIAISRDVREAGADRRPDRAGVYGSLDRVGEAATYRYSR